MSETPPEIAPMSCAEVRPYLSAYVDNELAEPLRSRIARHVAGCAECAARAERYRATDALLASLQPTTPSPDVFHAVMAAAREENAEPVEREALAAPFAGLVARRLRIVRPEPRRTDGPATLPATRKKGWIATAAPAVAALLLVTLAALAFRGLATLPRADTSQATATPVGTIQQRTQAQIAAISKSARLPFTPVLPAYAPDGVSGVDVSLGYADDNKTVIYLKIVWTVTFSSYLDKIIIRESSNAYEFPGYVVDSNGTGWQLKPELPWQPLRNASIGNITTGDIAQSVAAGQHRIGSLYIAVEAVGVSSFSSENSLKTALRQVTLSMDGENKQIPLAAAQTAGLILHYQAQSGPTYGKTPAWSVNVYVNPATDAQQVEVSVNGILRYVDVTQGTQGYRRDAKTHAYASGTRDQLSGDMNLATTSNVLQIFRAPGALLQSDLIWYSGHSAKVNGANAHDYILVSAPNLTHVYIDQRTKQVVQVNVETNVTWSFPPSTEYVYGRDGCSYFTLIEYMQPENVPPGTFSPTPPSDSRPGPVPPTVKCS
jgi:anti-sigma factor RsiW